MSQSPFQNQAFLDDVVDWCTTHGLLMIDIPLTNQAHKTVSKTAPIALTPSVYPASLFRRVYDVGIDFNVLIHRVACDSEFLQNSLHHVTDTFTKKLLRLLETANKARAQSDPAHVQSVVLGIFRSDYMLDNRPVSSTADNCSSNSNQITPTSILSMSQVELNTIAASFSNLSSRTGALHQYLYSRFQSLYDSSNPDPFKRPFVFPENPSMKKIPHALQYAKKLYKQDTHPASVIMMIVHPNEANRIDQRWLEYTLFEEYGVKVIRKSLKDVNDRSKLNSENELWIDGDEVAVAYFRAGYGPEDYPSEDEWKGREIIEISMAIKCPNVAYHLAGCKKIQQILAQPKVVEKYLTDPEQISRIRSTFTGLYTLDESEDKQAVEEICKRVLQNPEAFVMKPQREGGGNNIYGKDIPAKLDQFKKEGELSSYIVMDRIFPPSHNQWFLRDGKCFQAEAISELGIFSVFISDLVDNVPYLNESAGYLLRTKTIGENEGGVNAGASALDSVRLDLSK